MHMLVGRELTDNVKVEVDSVSQKTWAEVHK